MTHLPDGDLLLVAHPDLLGHLIDQPEVVRHELRSTGHMAQHRAHGSAQSTGLSTGHRAKHRAKSSTCTRLSARKDTATSLSRPACLRLARHWADCKASAPFRGFRLQDRYTLRVKFQGSRLQDPYTLKGELPDHTPDYLTVPGSLLKTALRAFSLFDFSYHLLGTDTGQGCALTLRGRR